MKKIICAISMALVAFAISADEIEAGSSDAAEKVVSDFLAETYNAPKEGIFVEDFTLDGLSASVSAVIPGKRCLLKLTKNDDETNLGWTVEQHDCSVD